MSNPIRWDPPLVRALAAELAARLVGRAVAPSPVFAGDLSATLPLDRGQALRWDLHPAAGWVRLVPRSADLPAPTGEARVAAVHAPPDERRLHLEVREGNRFRGGTRALVVELHTNQWNALWVDAATGRIVSVLRAREAGGRVLRAGEPYAPPAGEPRFGARRIDPDPARHEWRAVLAPLPPAERARALVRRFADASPLNAGAILGAAAGSGEDAALDAAFERWWSLRTEKEARPVLLRLGERLQPYPLPLDGVEAAPADSLLAAMEAAAEARARESADADRADLLRRARKRRDAAERRAESLRGELARVGDADALRERGDLILAYLHLVPAGASSARLPAFDGGLEVEVPLDPTLRPQENARRCYDEAARLDRARERLPALLAEAEAEGGRWRRVVEAAEAGGELPADEGRILAREEARRPAASGAAAAEGERKPYRLYRSSGGLEIRVGRGSKDNDRLTFGHSSPEDVWLHARQVPGSHVVLRWADADAAPPARDLEEAATLAAWYSRARTSGTVAVDWTRRKHVRKPRGAPPGRVTLGQAKTVFVAPSEAAEQRLRADAEAPAAG